MKKFCIVFFIVALGLGIVIGDFTFVNAQGMDVDEFTLEEITVTAQKREENQQKVPITMEVLSGEQLQELGKNDMDEILSNISSVVINQADDGLRVTIRGMSNDNAPFGNMDVSTPTVAVNKDGVYTNRNAGNTDLYDIERVEVLFGPQSTMYASASPGGIVNVVTANPKTDRYEASGTLEYGNYDLLKTEGSMNAPIGEYMALRAAFSTSVRDGYLTNGGMDEDSKSARVKYLFQPNDRFSIVLTAELTETGGQGFASVEQFVDEDSTDNPWTATSDTPGNSNSRDNKKVYANIDLDIDDIGTLSLIPTLTVMSNYRSGVMSGGGGPPPPPGMEPVETLQTDQGSGSERGIEARMTSSEEAPFKWILGVNYYKSREDQSQVGFEQGDDGDDIADNIGDRWNDQIVKAIYGNLTYPVTDRFRGTAGIRKTWDENTSYNHQIPGKPPTPDELIEGTYMEYTDPSYKVGFEYDLSENSMLYGDWSTSYRTQAGGTMGAEKKPEELSAYTMGAKNRFFGNKLQLNASAYYYDYENYFAVIGPLMTIVDENGNGLWDVGVETQQQEDHGNLAQGDARIYGFDLQTSTIITSKDRLDFNLSYIKKEFTDMLFDYYDITNDIGLPDIDYSGKEMPSAPNWTATINYSHNFSLPNGGTLTPRVEGRYSSKYVLNFQAYTVNIYGDATTGDLTPVVTDTSAVRWQEDYTMSDFSMAYADPNGKFLLNAYVKNAFNYPVKRGMMMGSFMIGPPRTYGATLTVRY